jgi:isoleucyl-tRNA synthetase
VRAQQHEELALAREGALAVALDLTIDDELRAEGIARELVRLVNDVRKAQGLEISQRIDLTVESSARVADAARQHSKWIASEVLATSMGVTNPASAGAADAVVDGTPVWLTVLTAAK